MDEDKLICQRCGMQFKAKSYDVYNSEDHSAPTCFECLYYLGDINFGMYNDMYIENITEE